MRPEPIWLKHYDKGVPHHIDYPSIPVHALLERTAERFPDRVATDFFNATLTYRQLLEQANRFAAALQGLGVKKGDRVAIVLPNSPQYVVAFFGILKAGGIAVNHNPLYTAAELEHQLNDAGCTAAVILDLVYPKLQEILPRTRLRQVIVTRIQDGMPWYLRPLVQLKQRKEGQAVRVLYGPTTHRWTRLLKEAPATPKPVPVEPDDVALFQYTGGTTGVPKGAMLTHRNLVANMHQVRAWMADLAKDGEEVTLCALPFFHVYGMTVGMGLSVVGGFRMVLVPRVDVEELMKLIEKKRVSVFPGVPTLYMRINTHPRVKEYDLSSIRACISGAAPLPAEVQKTFEQITGGKLVEGYGMTEASPVTHSTPLQGLRKIGSVGIPFPDTLAWIVDEEGNFLPIGEVGEIVVKGPQVMKGYWNRPEANEQVFLPGGWLRTGDIGRMDEDGYFYIVDRKKEMINVSGLKVYPREVEEVLYTHPAVREAAVVGTPDPKSGERVKAFVALKEGAQATEEELIAYCRERLARYKVPVAVEFRDELPKSLVGKILRRVLWEEEQKKAQAREEG